MNSLTLTVKEVLMFTRNAMLSLMAVALLAGGCDTEATDSLLPPDVIPEASLVEGQKMVPVEWTYHVWAVDPPSVLCLWGEEAFGAVAPLYAVSGHLTHLGRLDEHASSATIHTCEVIMGTSGPEGLTGRITARLVGPQGDAVDLDGSLTLIFAAGHAIGHWDIVGGAGRFVEAGGYLDTLEQPVEDGIGSVGSGSGMITLAGPMKGGHGPGR
jgi:hypothetical protein